MISSNSITIQPVPAKKNIIWALSNNILMYLLEFINCWELFEIRNLNRKFRREIANSDFFNYFFWVIRQSSRFRTAEDVFLYELENNTSFILNVRQYLILNFSPVQVNQFIGDYFYSLSRRRTLSEGN